MSGEDSSRRQCLFCNLHEEQNEDLGQMLHKGGITVHQNCLYFSSGLCQTDDTENGLMGFKEEHIRGEIRRGLTPHMKCCGCGKKGIYVGCAVSQCKKAGHLPCIIKEEFLLQFYDVFKVFCPTHRPKQSFNPPIDSSNNFSCPICLSGVSCPPSSTLPFSILLTPCCNRLCHRTCIQQQARSAGEHYFRCPFCNNQDQFNREMQLMGIEIPSRDASWETCDQFYDLHNPSAHCNLPLCQNSQGRSHYLDNNKIIDCEWCGQCIGHLNCIRPYLGDPEIITVTDTGSGKEYVCKDCTPVYNRKRKIDEDKEATPTKSFTTPKKRKTSLSCDKQCNVTSCSCIYGRGYFFPGGPYKLIQCSQCQLTIGHSECVQMSMGGDVSVKGGRHLCKGCGQYSPADNMEEKTIIVNKGKQGVESDRNSEETKEEAPEIIVIDDTSSDSSLDIYTIESSDDEQLKTHPQDNLVSQDKRFKVDTDLSGSHLKKNNFVKKSSTSTSLDRRKTGWIVCEYDGWIRRCSNGLHSLDEGSGSDIRPSSSKQKNQYNIMRRHATEQIPSCKEMEKHGHKKHERSVVKELDSITLNKRSGSGTGPTGDSCDKDLLTLKRTCSKSKRELQKHRPSSFLDTGSSCIHPMFNGLDKDSKRRGNKSLLAEENKTGVDTDRTHNSARPSIARVCGSVAKLYKRQTRSYDFGAHQGLKTCNNLNINAIPRTCCHHHNQHHLNKEIKQISASKNSIVQRSVASEVTLSCSMPRPPPLVDIT